MGYDIFESIGWEILPSLGLSPAPIPYPNTNNLASYHANSLVEKRGRFLVIQSSAAARERDEDTCHIG